MTKVKIGQTFSFKKIHKNLIIFKHRPVQFLMLFLLVHNTLRLDLI